MRGIGFAIRFSRSSIKIISASAFSNTHTSLNTAAAATYAVAHTCAEYLQSIQPIMAPSRTSTVKSKHAANKSGIKNSKASDSAKRSTNPGVSKTKAPKTGKGTTPLKGKAGNAPGGVVKKKRRFYTEKELDIPALNMITPVGVEKPKGKKKGKVFVDDRVSIRHIHPQEPF